MPSRSQMDTPAMVAVVILGIVLIAASVPFLDSEDGDATAYSIRWSEEEAGSSQANTGAAGSTTTVRVPVSDVLPSNATIALESCTDGAQPPATQPATITWTLFEGDDEKDSGTFQCGDSDMQVALDAHPDVGEASASSAGAAVEKAFASAANKTVEYRLEFSWSRPGGALPLPLPVGTAFSATLSLTIDEWAATAVAPDQEVPR